MTPGQEADLLAQWFTELYQDTESPPALPFNWPCTSSEFCEGLRSLPLRKALAPEYVPSPFWKLTAQQVSTYLDPALHEWSSNARFPQCWSDGTLVFLPKTKKRTQTPSELRPISLLEPCGKSVMGMCASQILAHTWQELQRWPQFAYLPARGVDEALHRILQHCRRVRDLIDTYQFRVHMQAQGLERLHLCGGLTISLDLTKAFDMVNRCQLLEGLNQFNIPCDLIELLKAIYQHTAFQFQHKGESRSFETRRGIRQGCRAAPTLWAVFSVMMLRAIAHRISFDWVLACVTLFADDGTFHQVLESEADFHRAIKFIGIALDTIESFNMKVNVSKTVAVLRMVGPLTKRLNRKYLKRTSEGIFLRIPRQNHGETHIKLVRHFQYLGATVSYHSFERLTMDARIRASEKVGQQLHRWVYVRSSVPISLKLRIWKQCIFASLLHSLIIVGFTQQSLQAFDIACMKKLRRIFRNPVHLTHLSRVAFLRAYGAEDPLLLLSELNSATEQRDSQKRHCLDPHDVILLTPAKDFAVQSSLIWEVWHRRGSSREEVPESPHVCPRCFQIYATLAALRRHLTLDHGDRSGPLHAPQPTDFRGGVPTCAHCNTRFTTKQSLQYHITFVCTADRQDLEQVEHRLRIQELLQVARSHQLQALANNAQLLAYFYTRCALCNTFCTTTTGLLQHWKMEHDREFRQHEPFNTALLQACIETNPCQFCGACFKRTHRCHIIRQVALLMVQHGIDMQVSEDATSLTCPYCQKVYTTRHGLQSHVNVYHMAEQACEHFKPEEVEMYCLVHQAVQTEEAEDLLGNPSIQHFLANTCLSFRKTFNRKNELKRHFRANHPSEWHEAERRAMIMDERYKPHHGCVCHPTSHIKHICVFYIQFALLRLSFERQQMPQVVALPPDQLLSPEDYIEPLTRLGHVQALYKMPHLKYQLSTICQVCGLACENAEALRLHLHAAHSDHLQEVQTLRELLVWTLFGDLGCFCNPSHGWGTAAHECTGLIQLALVIHELRMQIVVPWAFNSTDVMHLLSDMMPLPSVQRVGLALMSRQFYWIWQDPILLRTLATRCLLCQEAVDLQCIHAHLRVFHQVEPERVWYMVQQLCQVYANLMMEGAHCEWCRELMPSYFTDDELQYDPEEHLKSCPMMTQMALLLMMPRWSKPMLPLHTWPRQEDIAENHRLLELRIWQHNADPSDTYGMSLDIIAKSGLDFAQDAWIADGLMYRCLICAQSFFIPTVFARHLHTEHNTMQTKTLMCLHRLEQTCLTPCQFCGQNEHSSTCIPLLNLAIFLINGQGLRRYGGSGLYGQNLGQSVDRGSIEGPRHHREQSTDIEQEAQRGQGGQQRQEQACQQASLGNDVGAKRPDDQHGQTGIETRRHLKYSPTRVGVRASSCARGRFSASTLVDEEPGVAQGTENYPPAPHIGGLDDDGLGGAPHQVSQRGHGFRSLSSVYPAEFDHQGEDNAVPALGCESIPTDTQQRSASTTGTGPEIPDQYPPIDGGQRGHASISCTQENPGFLTIFSANTLAMDGEHASHSGAVERDSQSVLSQHLATHTCQPQATKPS